MMTPPSNPSRLRIGTILTALAALILLSALPSAIRDTVQTGRVYLFSWQFLEELPQRLTGPGRLRFIFQPIVAILLGWRGGLGDARAGRKPFLYSLILERENRKALALSGATAVRNLVAVGIILDSVSQLLIYGQVHPGAALVIGPVLICVPYAVARALTNRVASLTAPRSIK
jgi:hypothetical protein